MTETPDAGTGPLVGIKVLDLTRALAGPYCTMLLGDMGAEVWKIEPAPDGDMIRQWGSKHGTESVYFLSANRNKQSCCLDLRHPKAQAAVRALARQADVLVENFRPGVTAAMGLDYPSLERENPRLVYCSITGFGPTGPYAERPCFDQVAQGMSGLMSVTGSPETGPLRVGVPIGDILSGMFAAYGVALALLDRERTGRGQSVDTSVYEALLGILVFQAQRYLSLGEVPHGEGNDHPIISPYGAFEAADGWLNLAVATDDQFRRLAEALEAPEWVADPRFRTNPLRVEHRAALTAAITARLKRRRVAEWVDVFAAAGLPCGPIHPVDRALAEPQVAAREMVVTVEHPTLGLLRLLGVPVKLGRTPGGVRLPPPRLGEHTRSILARAGLAPGEIQELVATGAAIVAS